MWLWLGLALAAPPDIWDRNCGRFYRQVGPESPLVGACYYRIATMTGQWTVAQGHLERLRAKHPDAGGYSWALANVRKAMDPDDPMVPELLAAADKRFEAAGDDKGRVFTLASWADFALAQGKMDTALEVLETAAAVADASGSASLLRTVQVQRAQTLYETGVHMAEAVRMAEEVLAQPRPPGESYTVRARTLNTLTRAYQVLGRLEAAEQYAHDLAALYRANKDRYSEAQVATLELELLAQRLDRDPRVASEEELEAKVAAVLARTAESGNVGAQAHALYLAARIGDADKADARLEACLALEVDEEVLTCRLQRAIRARDAAAIEAVAEAKWIEGGYAVRSEVDHARLLVAHALGDEARYEQAEQDLLADLRLLDAFEPGYLSRLRRREQVSALLRLAAGWRFARGDLGRGLALAEAARARQGAAVPVQSDAYTAVLERIATLQRQLREGRDEATLAELAAAEREEARLVETSPVPALPTLEADLLQRLQAALGPGQAVLLYSLDRERYQDGNPGGGSWAVVVRADRAEARALGDGRALNLQAETLSAVAARPDGAAVVPAARALSRALVDPVLPLLDGVDELVLVTDGALHTTPVEALAGLGTSMRVSRTSSVRLWLSRDTPPPAKNAVALVDPVAQAEPSQLRGFDAESLASLGRLPATRLEAQALRRSLGRGRVAVHAGAEATEAALAGLAEDVGWVHLGAHALVDNMVPERSAVLLTPDAAQDGLFQLRDITALDWRGRTVVLAACQTADGERLDSAGPLGLAQAFLDAGASTVLASLWPVSDQRAAAFFDAFYTALGEGVTADEALRRARVDRERAGDPVHGWAGFVMLGDGAVRVEPGRGLRWPWLLPIVLLGVLAGGWRLRAKTDNPRG